jgi:hypothetical protein
MLSDLLSSKGRHVTVAVFGFRTNVGFVVQGLAREDPPLNPRLLAGVPATAVLNLLQNETFEALLCLRC